MGGINFQKQKKKGRCRFPSPRDQTTNKLPLLAFLLMWKYVGKNSTIMKESEFSLPLDLGLKILQNFFSMTTDKRTLD